MSAIALWGLSVSSSNEWRSSMPGKTDLASNRPHAGVRNPDASSLDRPAAVSHGNALCRCEPVVHKAEQFGRESRNEPRIDAAVLSCIGEHFKCKASSMAHSVADDTEATN